MSDGKTEQKRTYLTPALHTRPVAQVERLIADAYAVQTERWRLLSKRRRPGADSSSPISTGPSEN